MAKTSWLNEFAAPEQSYLYSSSEEMGPKIGGLGDFDLQMSPEIAPQVQAAQNAGNMKALQTAGTVGSAAALPFLATPWGAAALIGTQAIMQIKAQKAADERAKRQNLAQIEQNKGAQTSQSFDTILEGYRGLK
jgi:hypothetical protein